MKVEDCMSCGDFKVIRHITYTFRKINRYMCLISNFDIHYMNRKGYECPRNAFTVEERSQRVKWAVG